MQGLPRSDDMSMRFGVSTCAHEGGRGTKAEGTEGAAREGMRALELKIQGRGLRAEDSFARAWVAFLLGRLARGRGPVENVLVAGGQRLQNTIGLTATARHGPPPRTTRTRASAASSGLRRSRSAPGHQREQPKNRLHSAIPSPLKNQHLPGIGLEIQTTWVHQTGIPPPHSLRWVLSEKLPSSLGGAFVRI